MGNCLKRSRMLLAAFDTVWISERCKGETNICPFSLYAWRRTNFCFTLQILTDLTVSKVIRSINDLIEQFFNNTLTLSKTKYQLLLLWLFFSIKRKTVVILLLVVFFKPPKIYFLFRFSLVWTSASLAVTIALWTKPFHFESHSIFLSL